MLKGRRQAPANVAAASEHDAFHRLFEFAQLTHDGAYVWFGSKKKYLVTLLDDGITARHDRAVTAIDRRHPRIDATEVIGELAELVSHDRPFLIGLDGN